VSDNQAQIEFWNGDAGDTWVESQTYLDTLLQPLSDEALRRAAVQPGERVLDVGCGCGSTSLAMHAAGAAVWGVDISAPMLALAKSRASGLTDIAFSQTDAATQQYTADHQLVFSRFGVMFFADPVAAFTQLHSALSDAGRMLFMCWQAPAHNPWISVVARAIQPFMPTPDTPPDPREPGPFAFAEADYVRDILQQAGFQRVQIDGFSSELPMAQNLDEALDMQTRIGPMARVLAELQGQARDDAVAAARAALAEHMTDDGLHLGAAVWMVSASR